MKQERPTMSWWAEAVGALGASGVRTAAAGAVAANAYMPPRYTADIDLAVTLDELGRAGDAMRAAGWSYAGDLRLYEDLEGTAWTSADRDVDLIGLPREWGRAAVEAAQTNILDGLPTLTLSFVVLTKLISGRMQDAADITRMLGAASEAQRDSVRGVVARWRPEDLADLEQMIAAGKLEFGR